MVYTDEMCVADLEILRQTFLEETKGTEPLCLTHAIKRLSDTTSECYWNDKERRFVCSKCGTRRQLKGRYCDWCGRQLILKRGN